MKKTYSYTNALENQVIAKVDGDREEQPKQWRVTNLPNGEPDRLFVNRCMAELWATRYKWKHNLAKVEKINEWPCY